MAHRNTDRIRRRRFLKATGGTIAVGSAGLAGCLGDEEEPDPMDADDDPADDDPAEEPDEDPYANYPEDTVQWVVPYGTGGGFDLYSRFAAEHMPEFLPGDGEIVVENLTGAGGQRGAEEIYRADPDGYTLGIYNIPGMIASQFLTEVEYDVDEMSWIGTFNQAQYGILVPADSEYETLEDLQEADEISWGGTGPGATSSLVTFIAAEELGIPSDFVFGYEGGEEARAGMLRGEVDARMNDFPAAESFVRDGEMRFIVALSADPPDWIDAPTVVDEGYDDLAELGLSFMATAPPGIDDELQEVLSDAFLDALDTPEAQEFAEDTDRPINPLGPEETRQAVEAASGLVDQYQDTLEEHMN